MDPNPYGGCLVVHTLHTYHMNTADPVNSRTKAWMEIAYSQVQDRFLVSIYHHAMFSLQCMPDKLVEAEMCGSCTVLKWKIGLVWQSVPFLH